MTDSNFKSGSQESFDSAWKNRSEASYIHWGKGNPNNQIQLAFQNHYQLFSIIHKSIVPGPSSSILEVGCGRGSLSAHYASDGYQCSLLDTSESIISVAKQIFSSNSLTANFFVGDAERLPFHDSTFDVVTSIGLLEHFDNPTSVIKEKLRVVKMGGWVVNYIVPNKTAKVQKWAAIPNLLLKILSQNRIQPKLKDPVYRTSNGISEYLSFVSSLEYTEVFVSGTYTYPMISPSSDFPFTLNNKATESILVFLLKQYLRVRKWLTGRSPWLCDEDFGHAIVVALKK